MKNEVFFLIHIFIVLGFVFGALRLGKGSLAALISLQVVLANFFVVKQMDLLGFSVTCSDVFAIGAILGLNLLQEHYGPKEAMQAVRTSFFTLLFFVAMSQMQLLYQPIHGDDIHEAFGAILSTTPRIAFASMTVFYVVQRLDVPLFGWLKNRLNGRYLPFRIGISLVLSQLLDTVLFSFLGLYGLVVSLFDVIAISFFIKCLIIGFSSPITAFSKRFMSEKEAS